MRQGEIKGEAGRERDKDGRDGDKEREVAKNRWRDKERVGWIDRGWGEGRRWERESTTN